MQTFLPHKDFKKTAKCLDMKRLGKQRVETMQIMNALLDPDKGWKNHPATKMWSGYESGLLYYQIAICKEWVSRGYNDTCLQKTLDIYNKYTDGKLSASVYHFPTWLGDEAFHAAHRSNLLRKDKDYYGQFDWSETDDLEYVWPVK